MTVKYDVGDKFYIPFRVVNSDGTTREYFSIEAEIEEIRIDMDSVEYTIDIPTINKQITVSEEDMGHIFDQGDEDIRKATDRMEQSVMTSGLVMWKGK